MQDGIPAVYSAASSMLSGVPLGAWQPVFTFFASHPHTERSAEHESGGSAVQPLCCPESCAAAAALISARLCDLVRSNQSETAVIVLEDVQLFDAQSWQLLLDFCQSVHKTRAFLVSSHVLLVLDLSGAWQVLSCHPCGTEESELSSLKALCESVVELKELSKASVEAIFADHTRVRRYSCRSG